MASANDPTLHSWIDIPSTSDFPIQNLPFGVFETDERGARLGVAIGGYVLDLYAVSQWGFFDDLDLQGKQPKVFRRRSLNAFIRLGRPAWRAVRERVSELLRHDNPVLQGPEVMRDCLLRQTEVRLLCPLRPRQFVRFAASFPTPTPTPPASDPLPTPVGHYAPAASVVASGTRILRPARTYLPPDAEPLRGPVQCLDAEAQLGLVGGRTTPLGTALPLEQAEDALFGVALLLTARAHDLHPGGPLPDNSCGSCLAPWVVMLEALAPFRVAGPPQLPEPEPHLRQNPNSPDYFAVQLELALQPAGAAATVVATPDTSSLYWSAAQQLAYLTGSGAPLQAGDLYATAPVAGGSLHALTANGTQPLLLDNGTQRTYLEDNDTVRLRGHCQQAGVRIGFGEVTGQIG